MAAQQASLSTPRFQPAYSLPQTQELGSKAALATLRTEPRRAISLANGQFFGGAFRSLVTGYAVGTGGVVALQAGVDPTAGEAFEGAAHFFDAGVRPDFLAAADVNGDGHQDLIAAARDGSVVRVLLGDNQGELLLQPALPVSGRIASLTTWRGPEGTDLIAVGVAGGRNAVDLYRTDGSLAGSIPLNDAPSILTVANVNRHALPDLIVGGAGTLAMVDGASLAAGSPRVDVLPIANAVAATAGFFSFDQRMLPQVAVLTADGSVHILARQGVEATPAYATVATAHLHEGRGSGTAARPALDPTAFAWTDYEVLPAVANLSGGGQPLLTSGNLSGSGCEDLVVTAGGVTTTIAHPVVAYPAADGEPRGSVKALPPRIETLQTPGALAVAPARLAQDVRMGMVLADGSASPQIAQLQANRTFVVNTTADSSAGSLSAARAACRSGGSGCTLRAAFAEVNADTSANERAGYADTVNIPAGTYYLTATNGSKPVDTNGDYDYHIILNGPSNIIGAGAASTILNGTATSNIRDKFFTINYGFLTGIFSPFSTYIGNLTFTGGYNQNTVNGSASNPYGGALDDELYGTGNLTLVNVNMTSNSALNGWGGALFVSNTSSGNGTLEIDGGAFAINQTSGPGGAVCASGGVPILINGAAFSSNVSDGTLNKSSNLSGSSGGAISFSPDTSSGVTSRIVNSIFSGNKAGSPTSSGFGGALYGGSGLNLIDNQFLNNSASDTGGGVYLIGTQIASSITGNTFTRNTSLNAGGIFVSNETNVSPAGQSISFRYNRLTGNTATSLPGRTGLGGGTTTANNAHAPIDATDNFWGCNGAATGTGCDTASVSGTGTFNLTPYTVLYASLNAINPAPGTSITLTSYLNTDSTAATLSTLNAFSGVAGGNSTTSSGYTSTSPGGTTKATLTFKNLDGTVVATTTTSTDSTAQAALTATVTASGTASATIDNVTVSRSYTVTTQQPTASVAFSPGTVALGGTGTLTFLLTNPNANVALTGVSFNDSLPAGLTVQGVLSSSCGSVSTTSGSVTLSGGTIGANSSCSVAVTVSPTSPGSKSTMISVGASSANGPANFSNTATLAVSQGTPGITVSAPATANRSTSSTLSAVVTVGSGLPAPTGSVNFYAGATYLGAGRLNQTGSTTYGASLTSTALPSGSQSITAQYPGDSNYTSVTSTATTTLVVANIIWIGNPSAGTVSAFDPGTGAPFLASPETSGGTGVAIDSAGSVWSLKPGANAVAKFTNTGAVTSAGYTGGGLSSPAALAIDGQGAVWIANGNNSVSVFNNDGTAFSATAYKGGTGTYPPANTVSTFSTPTGAAIDTSGNLWIVNSGSSSVTEVIGVASPTVSPLATGVANVTLGTQP